MDTVSVSRTISGPPEPIRDAMHDTKAFLEAAGFKNVTVTEDRYTIEKDVGLLSISLKLQFVDRDAELTCKQVDGIFKSMETRYYLEPENGETTVRAVTEYELDPDIVGPILDETIITRQRTKELEGQLDYLEAAAATADQS